MLRPLVTTLLLVAAASVKAESLRCAGGIAAEGDSRLSVIHKCGPPTLADAFCEPLVYRGTLDPVREPFAGAFVQCQLTEEWLYDRGPGNLVAVVRLRSGSVQSIVYRLTSR